MSHYPAHLLSGILDVLEDDEERGVVPMPVPLAVPRPLPTPVPTRSSSAAAAAPPPSSSVQAPAPAKRGKARFRKLDLSEDYATMFSGLPASGVIDPRHVMFSQSGCTLSYQTPFSMGRRTIRTVNEHIAALREDPSLGGSTPPIQIVLYKGQIMTINNRRLYAHKEAGVKIRYEKIDLARPQDHPNVDPEAPRSRCTLRS